MTELIQFRADKELKQEVSAIYESLGMDLPTAFRMFLVRSKAVRGLPFPAVMPDGDVTRADALDAFSRLRSSASDVTEMSLDEINAEIAEARNERRGK